MRKILFAILSVAALLLFAGCDNKANVAVSGQTDSADIKGDVGNDICKEFSADFVYSATGKAVVKVEPDKLMPKLACRYYFTYDPNFYKGVTNKALSGGGAHIFVMLENLNVANQKKGAEILGATTRSEAGIKMANMVTLRENGTIWDIKLIINPNRFVRTDYANGALTDEQLIDFAAKLAENIQGNLSFTIKKNPAVTEEQTPADDGKSRQDVVSLFLDNLGGHKIGDALKMMDANDETKKAWEVNLNTIESLKTNKIEEAFKEEWSATRQSFKVELEVKVKPEGLQYGWENGRDFRWITLEKNAGGVWMIHEIANNP